MSHFNADFFNECYVETSDFNKNFAENDPSWRLLKSKYDSVSIVSLHESIPKIIHFIWIGSDIPKMYLDNISVWREKNQSFDIVIWNDLELIPFLQKTESYQKFLQADNFGSKSDIARYEILKEFGGLYIDTDFLCLSDKFNTLHEDLSFYSCVSFEKNVNIFNGMIACIPNHPIIDLCIKNCNVDGFQNVSCKQTRSLYQTGPYLFTACVLHHLSNCTSKNEIVFPSKFFYPFPAILRDKISEELLAKFISEHSLACHLWHSSWQPKSKFFAGKTS